MKEIKLFICLFGMISICGLHAQIKTPPASPSCKMVQTVGLTEVTIEYSRPSKKDRDIFGSNGLVPFGEKWRTGANKNTTITFDDDVKVGNKDVKKGTYALFTTPSTNLWTIYLYDETSNWGLPKNWDVTKEVANFQVKPTILPFSTETMMISIGEITSKSATIDLIWDNVMVQIPMEVGTDKAVDAAYDKMMAGPSASDYYNLGSYYHETGRDLKKALEFVNLSLAQKEKFWMVRRKSMILADMGNYKDAISAAKKSIELAKVAGNKDYVRMNEKAISEWSSKKGK